MHVGGGRTVLLALQCCCCCCWISLSFTLIPQSQSILSDPILSDPRSSRRSDGFSLRRQCVSLSPSLVFCRSRRSQSQEVRSPSSSLSDVSDLVQRRFILFHSARPKIPPEISKMSEFINKLRDRALTTFRG